MALSGTAVVEFKVSTADGRVKETTVLEHSGDPEWASLVTAAIMKWRYQPTVPVGSPGTLVTLRQSFDYQYQNETTELGTRVPRRN